MKGDFSRKTFNKKKHYSSVRMQQGRVQLDADWNEQADILNHRIQAETKDIIGPSGAPETYAGFSVSPVGLTNIAVDKHYVYAVDELKKLQIINIEDTKKIKLESRLDISNNVTDIRVCGRYLYIAMGADGLKIIDIANPKNPKEIAYESSTPAYHVAAVDKVHKDHNIFVIDESKLSVLKFVEGEKANKNWVVELIYTINGFDIASDIIKSGNYLYVIDSTNLYILPVNKLKDINNVTDDNVRKIEGMSAARKITILDNRVYVVDNDGLHIIDVGDRNNPKKLNSIISPNMTPDSEIAITKIEDVTYAYVVDGKNLHAIDISNPREPKTFKNVYHDIHTTDTKISQGNLYIASRKYGLQILEPVQSGDLSTPITFKEISYATELSISEGRYYVDGLLCENDETIGIMQQADLIVDKIEGLIHYYDDLKKEIVIPSKLNDDFKVEDGFYLAYLDVWQRHISGLEDPTILEPALAGIDTATRIKNISQVKLLELESGADTVLDSESIFENPKNKLAWSLITAPSTGRMQVRLSDTASLVNKLYRIEIHKGGTEKAATFKWSRDNANVVAKITFDRLENKIRIIDFNPDKELQFRPGQWVELTNEQSELQGEPGPLVLIGDVKDDELSIVGGDRLPDDDTFSKVRTWDMSESEGRLIPADYVYLDSINIDRKDNLVLALRANESIPTELAKGTFIEITNQNNIGLKKPGGFTQIIEINRDKNTIIAHKLIGASQGTLNNLDRLRLVGSSESAMDNKRFFALENGLELSFKKGNYKSGDYWLIPTRALTNKVEWPKDEITNEFAAQPPQGTYHHYAPLAIIKRKNNRWFQCDDCRVLFSSQLNKAYQAATDAPGRSIYVDSSGSVGIGVDTEKPKGKLHIDGKRSGTGLISSNGTKVTGGHQRSTFFQSELDIGDMIIVGNDSRTVVKIVNNQLLNINAAFPDSLSNQAFAIGRKTLIAHSNVGIGTDAPEAELHIKGNLKLEATDAPGRSVYVDSSGSVGIGTDSPEADLHVDGKLKLQAGNAVNEITEKISVTDNNYRPNVIPTEKAIQDYIDSLFVGTVSAFAMETAPDGWLECDGREYTLKEHPNLERLYKKIKNTFGGTKDQSFKVPDLRGEFIRGWDHEKTVDLKRQFGTWQSDLMQSHTHKDKGHHHGGNTYFDGRHSHEMTRVVYDNGGAYGCYIQGGSYLGLAWGGAGRKKNGPGTVPHKRTDEHPGHIHKLNIANGYAELGEPIKFENYGNPRDGKETRPRNVALLFCIKY